MKMICPTCHNDPKMRVVTALVNRNGECFMEAHECPTCDASGEIDKDQFERMAAGRVVREARIDLKLTFYQLAQCAGVSPLDVSDYERGRLPNDDEHADIRDKLYAAIQNIRTRVPVAV